MRNCVGAMLCGAAGAAGALTFMSALGAGKRPTPGPIEATSVRLVDAQGVTRGVWEVRDNKATLVLLDGEQRERIWFEADTVARAGVTSADRKRTCVLQDQASGAVLSVVDNGHERLRLVINEMLGMFRYSDVKGHVRVGLSDSGERLGAMVAGCDREVVWQGEAPPPPSKAPAREPGGAGDSHR